MHTWRRTKPATRLRSSSRTITGMLGDPPDLPSSAWSSEPIARVRVPIAEVLAKLAPSVALYRLSTNELQERIDHTRSLVGSTERSQGVSLTEASEWAINNARNSHFAEWLRGERETQPAGDHS